MSFVVVSHVEVDVGTGDVSVSEAERDAVRRYLRANPGASTIKMARDMPLGGWDHPQARLHRVLSAMAEEVDRGHGYDQRVGQYVKRRVYRRHWRGGSWWLREWPPVGLLLDDDCRCVPWQGPFGTYPHPRKDTVVDGVPVAPAAQDRLRRRQARG